MPIVAQPVVQVPVATVTIGGQTYECRTHPEFVRFFEGLLTRTGGTSAPTITAPGHLIKDEGVNIAQRDVLDFVGAGVTVADTGGTTQVTIPGGSGGATWTEVEIDFGTLPVYEAAFTITDAAITSSAMKVQVLPCGKAATGRTADDWQWDGATFAANPGTGSATCYAVFTPGPIVGRRTVQYSVGA
jgi:hypothetical protein